MFKQNDFKQKLVTLLMVVLPLVVVAYFIIYDSVNQRKEAEINKNLVITKSNALFIEHEINERLKAIRDLAELPEFREGNVHQMQQYLKICKESSGEDYFVIDTEGHIIVGTHTEMLQTVHDFRDCQHCREALTGKTVVTGMHKSVYNQEYVINLYTPIWDANRKRVLRVIGIYIPSSFFKAYLDPIRLGSNGALSLVDDSGYYIYDKAVSTGQKLVASPCFFDSRGQDVVITERKSMRTGKATVCTTVKLKSLGWYLIASQLKDEIIAPGLVIIAKDIITMTLLLMTLFALWRYKKSLRDRALLIERQNAEKLALVGELAAGMAHEIRNPLTTIKGFAELLKAKDPFKSELETLELIDQSVEHIEGIVRETLLLAKPQQMKVEIFDINEIVNETYRLMRNQAILEDVELEYVSHSERLLVKGDKRHLMQVLINIIKNAFEASPQHGAVLVTVDKVNLALAQVRVIDEGAGIPSEQLKKVGTPFFTTKHSGTGLGLVVSQRIVQEHGGHLIIESAPGQGTIIMIELPLVKMTE